MRGGDRPFAAHGPASVHRFDVPGGDFLQGVREAVRTVFEEELLVTAEAPPVSESDKRFAESLLDEALRLQASGGDGVRAPPTPDSCL